MGSLSGCGKKYGISQGELDDIRSSAVEFRADGYNGPTALIKAVASHIEELKTERDSIVSQIREAMPAITPAATPIIQTDDKQAVAEKITPASKGDQNKNKKPLRENAEPSVSSGVNQTPLIPGAKTTLDNSIINPSNDNVKPESGTKLEDFGEKLGGARKDRQPSETKETDKGAALFSRKNSFIGKAIGRVELDVVLNDFRSGLKNAPPIHVFETFSELAAAVPEIQAAAKAEGQDELNVSGVYHKGQVYIVRMKLASRADAEEVLFHEAFGHYGIRSLMGTGFVSGMTNIYNAIGGYSGLSAIAGKAGIDLRAYEEGYRKAGINFNDRNLLLAEELLTHIQGDRANQGVWQNIKELVGEFRAWLRSKGYLELAEYGETDLLYLMKRSAEYVRTGTNKAHGGTMFMTAWHGSPLMPFISQLEKVVNQKMGGKMPYTDLVKMLKSNQVTDDEITNLVGELADERVVTKVQVQEAIAANSVELKDVVLGGVDRERVKKIADLDAELKDIFDRRDRGGRISADMANTLKDEAFARSGVTAEELQKYRNHKSFGDELTATHFDTYQEPGAVNGSYREMFVTAPNPLSELGGDVLRARWQSGRITDKQFENAVYQQWQDGHSQYSDIQNPIVRIRFNDREVDGNKILFVEEMQGPSDANQKKMPAYLVKRMYDIGVKRVLAYAKENGYDGVSWTTGEMQAQRYDLSKTLSSITYNAQNFVLYGDDLSGKTVIEESNVSPDDLEKYIGKELTKKIADDISENTIDGTLEQEEFTYSDIDLKVGGEGLKSLYDHTLPAMFRKYGKEGVGKIGINFEKDGPMNGSAGDFHVVRLGSGKWTVRDEQSGPPFIDGNPQDKRFDTQAEAEVFLKEVQGIGDEYAVKMSFVPITDKTPSSYPMYSSAASSVSGVTVSDISDIVSKANNISNAEMSVEQSVSALPEFVLADMKERGIEKPEAVTYTKNGVTHIIYVADNIESTGRMSALMRHEWFHAGVADKELDALHKYYSQKLPDRLTEIAERRKFDLDTVVGRRSAAGELAAQEAEKGRINLFVRQMLAKVKAWLRSMGLATEFGDAEVADIIRQAISRVTEQADNGGYLVGQMTADSPLFSIENSGNVAMMKEKGGSHGNQLGDDERTSGRLGKSKAGDFAAAKNVAGAVYLASTVKARARDIRSEEERQLKEFALQHGLMLDVGPMMAKVESQGISGLDNHVYAEGSAFVKINKFTHAGTFSDLFINTTLHNKIFPEARLDFEGFVMTDNGLRPVFSQEGFVDEMPGKFQRMDLVNLASDALLRRGFNRTEGTNKTVENALFTRDDVVVRDISYRNVAYQGGEILFFDPVVELKPEARTQEKLRSILNGDENSSINYSVREQLNNISESATLDNLKRFLNPLDYSRFRNAVIDHRPPGQIDALAEHLGTPFWKKENNPAAVPFYEEAKDREVTRMDNNIRMFGGLVDRDGRRVGWDKLKGLFDWNDKTTAWGKVRQEQYDKLTNAQKAAYDVIRFEGDAYNKIYDSLANARRNRRIAASGIDAATFDFYKSALQAEQVAFEEKLKIAAENMAEAGISPEEIEGHIAEFRSKYASIKGWVHRDHGEGDYQVRVYQTVDRLDFDTDVVQHKGEPADRLRLGTFPGAVISKKIEEIVEIKGGQFKQLRNGAIVILLPEGRGVDVLNQIDDIPLTDDNGEYLYKVLVYNRYVSSSAEAKKLAAQVKGDYAAAMPRNHRAGYIYDTSWNRANKVQEEDYQVLKTSDMKLELILRNAIDKAKAKDEVSAADADAIKEELVRSTAEILLGRGAGLYQIRRAQYLIEGYDTDNAVKKYEDYVNGTAGLFSKARYALRQFHNMKSAPASIRAWATKYVSDSLRNMGMGDQVSGNIRAMVSLWYLGFNTSWMLVNSTQPYVLGQAELSRYTKGATAKIAKAEKDVLTGKLTDIEKALLQDIRVKSQNHDTAMAEMTGSLEGATGKASQMLHNVTQVAMALGQKVEVLNRHTMIIAAYRVFTEQGMGHTTALKKALDVNSMVNIDMGRYNLPGWAREPFGRTFYALQSYIQHMLNYLWNRSSSGNRVDQKAILRLLFAMFLIGGLPAGAPGGDELDKIILKLFGYSPKMALKMWMHKNAKEYGSAGEALEGFVWHGVPGAFKPLGIGLSLTGSTQLRIPFITSFIGGDDMFKALGGPVSGLATKGKMSIQAAIRGDYGRAVEYLMPTAFANPMSGIRQATDGVKTASGKRVDYQGKQLKMTAGEAAIRAFGLQPVRTADISEVRGFEKDLISEYNDRRKDALDNYRNSKKIKYIQEFNLDLKNSMAKGLVPLISADTMAGVWGKTNQKKNAWERANGY